jgi:mono/diheme cytochrome c family protein
VLKRSFIGFLVIVAVGFIGFFAIAWRPAIAPTTPPPASSFSADLVAKGAVLAGAGYCAVCHTAADGQPYAGGYGLATPFGVIYSANITPDPQTGIGNWSEAAFARAMHQGIARDGSYLFPAFPYDHFTKVNDSDIQALYAYLMTLPPVHAPAKPNTMPFPFNIRYLQAGWQLLFFHEGRFQPDTTKSAAWNRGAYLAQSLSHCGGCHTPRNAFGAEQAGRAYAGASIDGWFAPPLTAANPAPVPWTQEDLFSYLRTGVSDVHGTAAGPMAPVVHVGLARLPDADIQAIATYFADINGASSSPADLNAAEARAIAASDQTGQPAVDPDAHLYENACASCHYNSAVPLPATRPDLALNTALWAPDPSNFIRVVLNGISIQNGAQGAMMPGFANAMSDDEIASLAAYLRRTRTSLAPWPNLPAQVAVIRAQGPEASE